MDELDLSSAMDTIASDMGQSSEPAGESSPPPATLPEDTVSAPPKETSTTESVEVKVEAAQSAEPSTPALEAPKTWRPEAATAWASLPPSVQAEVLKREADMFKGIEEYKGKISTAQPLMEAVEPYMQVLRESQIEPGVMVRNLLQAQYMLARGTPQQKVAMLQKVARDYGIEWGADAQMMDPQISELQQRQAYLESQLAQQANEKTLKEVEAFVSELGEDGKPLRPYFNDVANDIVGLINAGQATDLQSAYEKAVWLNPVTRASEIQRANAAEAAKAQKAAEEARKAEAANVKTSAKAVTADSPLGSMDDTMEETLKAIKSRAS